MKLIEIRALSDNELEKFIVDNRLKLNNLQIDYRTKKVANIKEIASVKKELAQALTLKHERLLAKAEDNNE